MSFLTAALPVGVIAVVVFVLFLELRQNRRKEP
jgi:hypothetical protein